MYFTRSTLKRAHAPISSDISEGLQGHPCFPFRPFGIGWAIGGSKHYMAILLDGFPQGVIFRRGSRAVKYQVEDYEFRLELRQVVQQMGVYPAIPGVVRDLSRPARRIRIHINNYYLLAALSGLEQKQE